MNNYNFSTLNDVEFEEITKDLLNNEFKLGLKSFRAGRDKGIDLRKTSNTNKNEIVVQVKHYLNSTYANLKNILLKEELNKVKKLNPEKYIVVTSQKLSSSQRDEIKAIFSPYIKSDDDIFSQSDLNDLLFKHNSIEKKYYKLWLSSTNILNAIFNNAIESRTKYFLENLTKKMKYYVPTKKINEANEILKKEKILLITGQPGIGKTTLAEIIIFNRAKKGFKIHKVEDIEEAETIISDDPKEKQIFYFDDFLGANYAEIINSHKSETRLTYFVERIYNSPNKYLVLTTRTVVLNLATNTYEKINRSKINSNKFELKLQDYTRYEKALILYNHIFFNKISQNLFDIILKDKFYFKIIEHRNYTPRTIDFFTDMSKIGKLMPEQYKQFIVRNLENPEEIWSYSFQNQIQYFDRCFLWCLFTFGSSVSEHKLENSFNERLEFEKNQHNQIINTNQFINSKKILSNGFIYTSIYNFDNQVDIQHQFINPSLTDFLISYINNSISEKKSILSSIIYSEQFDKFNPKISKIKLEDELQLIIKKRIQKNLILDLEVENNNNITKKLNLLFDYCYNINIDDLLNQIIQKLNHLESWSYLTCKIFLEIFERIEYPKYPQLYEYCSKNFIQLIETILKNFDYDSYIDDIIEFFDKFEYDFEEYSNTEQGIIVLSQYVNNILTSSEDDKKSAIEDEVENIKEVNLIYKEMEEEKNNLTSQLNLTKTHFIKSFKVDVHSWEEQFAQNIFDRQMREAENQEYEEDNVATNSNYSKSYEDRKIENLFRK